MSAGSEVDQDHEADGKSADDNHEENQSSTHVHTRSPSVSSKIVGGNDVQPSPWGLQNKGCPAFDGEFDVITVHGINGNWKDTWAAREESKRGELPGISNLQANFNCRVMDYSYDPLEDGAKFFSRDGIASQASKLLSDIVESRAAANSDSYRAIVFAAHDLGGTIVKQALIQAASDPKFIDIVSSTKALVLFAYVHRFSDFSDLEDSIARLVFSGPVTPSPKILFHVRSVSKAISGINDAFVDSKMMFRARLVNVYSTNKNPAENIFDHYSVTTGLCHEINVGNPESHAYLACAPADTGVWTGISAAFEYGRDFFNDVPGSNESLSWQHTHIFQNIAVFLSSPMKPVLRTSTSQSKVAWLTADERFMRWHENTSSDILIVQSRGDSSHTSEQLYERIGSMRQEGDLISYFSFDQHDCRKQTMRNFIDTTIVQWICQRPNFLNEFSWGYEYLRYHDCRSYTTLDALYLLTKMRLFGVFQQKTVFILDHIDQCFDCGAWFWDYFAQLCANLESPFKFIIFTEPEADLHEWLKGRPVIDLDEQDTEFNPASFNETCAHLSQRASGLLVELIKECGKDDQLAHFVLDQFQSAFSSSLADALHPDGSSVLEKFIQSTVDRTMRRVPEEKHAVVTRILDWVLYSFRPLTIDEIESCLIGTSDGAHESCGQFSHAIESAEKDEFAHLVETYLPAMFDLSHHEVRFRHPKLRQIFQQAAGVWYDTRGTAHMTIAQDCLQYLVSDTGQTTLAGLSVTEDHVLATPVGKVRGDLASYAAEYWQEHYRLASQKTQLLPQVMEFLRHKATLRSWERARWFLLNPLTRTDMSCWSEMPLVASLGLPDILQKYLLAWDRDSRIHEMKQYALAEAARNGHICNVRSLLNLTWKDVADAQRILLAAIGHGDEDLLLELVSHISRHFQDFDWPPLLICRAAWLGQIRLVTLLIQKDVPLDVGEKVFSQQTPLHLAVRHDHLEVAELLTTHKPSLVHELEDTRRSPLEVATDHGKCDAVRFLLERGASKNQVTRNNSRPISDACFEGRLRVLQVLLEYGVDTDLEDETGDWWPPLPSAADNGFFQCAKALLDHGAKVDIKSPGGTALYRVAWKGDLKMCQILLDKGADPDHVEDQGPLLAAAVTTDNLDLIWLLVEKGASLDIRANDEGLTALHGAICRNKSIEIIEYLLNCGADANIGTSLGTPVLDACFNNSEEVVRLLVGKAVDLDLPNSDGWGPLHVTYDKPSLARILLQNGAKINSMGGTGRTPLFVAAEKNQAETVEVLLEFNPDIDIECIPAQDIPATALIAAVRSGAADAAKKLLQAGADINFKNQNGLLVMEYAQNDEMRNMLLEHHPDMALEDGYGDTVLHDYLGVREAQLSFVKALFCEGADIHRPNRDGMTPLCLAVKRDYLDITRFFLKHGANVAVSARKDGPPLHIACRRSSLEAVKLLLEASADPTDQHHINGNALNAACMRKDKEEEETLAIVKVLLEGDKTKADSNSMGGLYGFPLSTAALCQPIPIIKILLDAGAQVNVQDAMGRAPIHFAAYRNVAIFDLLHDAGADLSVRDNMGRTVAHCAVQSGDIDLVMHVLQKTKDFRTVKDVHDWTPLHYAARGCRHLTHEGGTGDRQQEDSAQLAIISHLTTERSDISARSTGLDRDWSPLMLARYHGALSETLELLKPRKSEEGAEKFDDTLHQAKRAAYQNWICDACFIPVDGLKYTCDKCDQISFCYKCYALRETLHPGHSWTISGEEYKEATDSQSEASAAGAESDGDVESGGEVESGGFRESDRSGENSGDDD